MEGTDRSEPLPVTEEPQPSTPRETAQFETSAFTNDSKDNAPGGEANLPTEQHVETPAEYSWEDPASFGGKKGKKAKKAAKKAKKALGALSAPEEQATPEPPGISEEVAKEVPEEKN